MELFGVGVGLGTVMSAVRIFRIARLFRLVRFMKGLNQLFTAFVLSVPKLANVGAILCLLIGLYAVLGMNLFAKVLPYDQNSPSANFRSFYKAVMLLVRSMTGEAFNDIMHSYGKDKLYYETMLGEHCEPMQMTDEGIEISSGLVPWDTPEADELINS